MGTFARTSGMRISGPNCLGLANVKDGHLSHCLRAWRVRSDRADRPRMPEVARRRSGCSWCGAVENGIGFSYINSTGNEADLDFTDFARYLLDDPDTRVIAGFVEGFKRADKFLEVGKCSPQSAARPIVLIKIGRSNSARGRQARILPR